MPDKYEQFGKDYRKVSRNSEYNTRRFQENFPNIEQKVDIVDFEYPFDLEFRLSDHPHSVYLDLRVLPPEMFRCNQAIPPRTADKTYCTATNYSYDTSTDYVFSYTYLGGTITQVSTNTGDARAVIYGSFTQKVGDFSLNPYGGVVVPKSGYYIVSFQIAAAFIVMDPLAAWILSVRKNGVIINQVIYSVSNGKLPPVGHYTSMDETIWGLCIYAREGDVLGGFVTAAALYGTPFGNGSTTIDLIGTG